MICSKTDPKMVVVIKLDLKENVAMRGNKYIGTVSSLYLNYVVYGMVNIILASHMSFLTEQLNTDKSGVSFLVAAIGMGRLLTLYIAGVLSDKFGRKPFVITSCALMVIFLVGIPFSPNVTVAAIFAALAGVANACMDSGTYPALMEIFPKSAGAATVLVRGFISIGAIILPLMVVYFMNHGIFYGVSFFIPALIYFINIFYLSKKKFPCLTSQVIKKKKVQDHGKEYVSKPKFWLEGLCLILIGFTGPALLYIVQLWLPTFGQQVIGLNEAASLKLLTYYSIGSLVSVFTLTLILHKIVKPVTVVLIYPVISILALISLFFFQSPIGVIISSFTIGFSISGVLQLALTVMSEFFGERKGQITGFIYTSTSIAYTIIPLITGFILKNGNVSGIFLFAIFINFIGICLAVLVKYRFIKVFYRKNVTVGDVA